MKSFRRRIVDYSAKARSGAAIGKQDWIISLANALCSPMLAKVKKRVKPLRTRRKKKKKLCALSGLCGFKKKG